jgi:hypothetical protein
MVQVLFVLNVLAVIGTLLIPLSSSTRGRAVWGWLGSLVAAVVLLSLIEAYYPSWVEPHWHAGIIWSLTSWALLIVGLIVAVRKPRKHNTPVAPAA